jgi:hypothetical protein
VLLAFPGMTSRRLVENAKMVAVVSGSVALEALMLKRPVVHFGNVPFCVMPDTMIFHAKEPDRLARDIQYLLGNHQHDENALIAYICAVIRNSVPLDFYSVLLARKGVYNPDSGSGDIEAAYAEHIGRLSEYILDRIKSLQNFSLTNRTYNSPA